MFQPKGPQVNDRAFAKDAIAVGTMVLAEEKPLLVVKQVELMCQEQDSAKRALLAYMAFHTLSFEDKMAFLALKGPPSEWFLNMIRLQTKGMTLPGQPVLSTDQRKLLVEVAVVYLRCCMPTPDGGSCVYPKVSNFSHSCYPNCHVSFLPQGGIAVHAIRPIAAKDELTIKYMPDERFRSTADRRYQQLRLRDFTCHCPRCDAPVDEMRQFSCFDPACTGHHCACQPLSDRSLPSAAASYTGVTYQGPHLLPCTACQRPPPAQYQAEMFELEKSFAQQISAFQNRAINSNPLDGHAQAQLLHQADEILALLPWHGMSVQLLELRHHCYNCYVFCAEKIAKQEPDADEEARMLQHFEQALRVVEGWKFAFPCKSVVEVLLNAAYAFRAKGEMETARALCLQGVHMHKIMHGRETSPLQKNGGLEELLFITHAPAGPSQLHCCAWCEETPVGAAMKLRQCGRCKAVAYCSRYCQEAHWVKHKPQCKKPGK